MAFTRINDIVLHYRLSGLAEGPVLVLVNSLGTDARIWDELIAMLGDRYRILSYDKRGHGLSGAPTGDYLLNQHVGDLVGLLDHLGIDRLVLAGVSVGGLIAQRLALLHSERLVGLILCDTAAKIGDAAMWNGRIASVRMDGMASIADAIMTRWFTPAYRREHPDDLAGWQAMLERMPVAGYAGTCATLCDADLRDEVAGIVVPTLVVVGDQDLATPVDLVRDTATKIPGAQFEIIEDCGHIPSIEQPAVLATLMEKFMQEAGHG